MWKYEVYSKKTNELLFSDTGFNSEYEAEYFAKIEANSRKIKDYYIRTIPITNR